MSPPTSLSPPTSSSPLDDCYVPRRLTTKSGSVDLRQHEKLRLKEKDEARVSKGGSQGHRLGELATAARGHNLCSVLTSNPAAEDCILNVLRFWSCTREAPSAWCATPRAPSPPSHTPWKTAYAPPSPCTTRSTPSPDSWKSEPGGITVPAAKTWTFCLA